MALRCFVPQHDRLADNNKYGSEMFRAYQLTKFVRTVFLAIQTHIYLPEDISSRQTSPAGMNYFRIGIELYRVNANPMFD